MTCREKATKEHPELVSDEYGGGVRGCPDDKEYGYLESPRYCNDNRCILDVLCKECWDRDIPETTNLIIGDEKVEHPDTDIPKTEEKKIVYAHIFNPEQNVNGEECVNVSRDEITSLNELINKTPHPRLW